MKRYDFDIYAGGAVEDGSGDYVLYEDAAKLQSERDALAAEVEGLRADAERYRLLRRKVCIVGGLTIGEFRIINVYPTYVAPDAATELDAAIDAAIDASRTTGGEGHE